MKFTIITVCYNAENTIEETIKSVINQSFGDYEYLIIDGASTDKTLNIIRYYSDICPRIKYVSEPDDGLYDAMNKGAYMAAGEYIQFLNAGDRLVDSDLLSRVAKKIETNANSEADIYFGDIIYESNSGNREIRKYGKFCQTLVYYLLGDCINHQSIFAANHTLKNESKKLEKHFPFADDKYQICADRDWMLRIKKQGANFIPIDEIICSYSLDDNSESIANALKSWDEAKTIVKKQLLVGYPIYLVIDAIRNSKFLSRMLHAIYKIVFIRK